MRRVRVKRSTRETDIDLALDLDGTGRAELEMPIGFMVHMLNTFAKHGLFDIELRASGDLDVDQHHLVEDMGIALGQGFAGALGEKRGVRRVGSCLYPMDETLVRAAVDLSGRPFLVFEAEFSHTPLIYRNPDGTEGIFQADIVEDFWQGFAVNALCALHLDILRGRSDHHKAEALFKAAARALRDAVEIDGRGAELIPSTKGTIA
jgi:imidazoleglycerol-phosphate dehydratase